MNKLNRNCQYFFLSVSDKRKRIFLYFCPVAGIGLRTDERLHKSTDSSGFCRNWHPGLGIATQLTNVN